MTTHHSIKTLPSHLKYLQDLHLVEERHGDVRLYPHTEQLGEIYKAVQTEFNSGITARMGRIDDRADDTSKNDLYQMVFGFCAFGNALREDQLILFPFFTPTCVTKLSLVQHVEQSESGGIRHSFRFFAGKEFLPDIYLSGKKVAFASHVLDRFRERMLAGEGQCLSMFLNAIFRAPWVGVMQPNNSGEAMALMTEDGYFSVLPFEETDSEFFFKTFLTRNELKSLSVIEPFRRLYWHYGPQFNIPGWYEPLTAVVLKIILEKYHGKQINRLPELYEVAKFFRDRKNSWPRYARDVRKKRDLGKLSTGKCSFGLNCYGPTMMAFGEWDARRDEIEAWWKAQVEKQQATFPQP